MTKSEKKKSILIAFCYKKGKSEKKSILIAFCNENDKKWKWYQNGSKPII